MHSAATETSAETSAARHMHAISTATTAYDTASLDLVLHPFNEDAYAHGSLDTHTHSHSLQSDGFALGRCISRCVLVNVGSVECERTYINLTAQFHFERNEGIYNS